MSIAAAVDEEAVGIMACGQFHRVSFDPAGPQAPSILMGGSLPAAVVIGVERQQDSARGSIAQLIHLGSVQASTQRTGNVAEPRLPQDSPIKQAFHQYDLMTVTNALPPIQSTLTAGQESMRAGITDAATVEVVIEWKDDAMGKGIEAFPCDEAGLLQIVKPMAQTHQPGTQTSAGCIADARLLD
jgi:hypothetical protein